MGVEEAKGELYTQASPWRLAQLPKRLGIGSKSRDVALVNREWTWSDGQNKLVKRRTKECGGLLGGDTGGC